MNDVTLYNAYGRKVPSGRTRHPKAFFGNGWKGANDDGLSDWAMQPIDINTLLRNDLRTLRARSRDLARNDDTAKRYIHLVKQNVLGHAGIRLQARNKMRSGKKPDKAWNDAIESEWKSFGQCRRYRGFASSPTACGTMTMRQAAWLAVIMRVVDGESIIQILRGYPHNKNRFAFRFLNPDLLDSGFTDESRDGNRIIMGVELDEFDRPIAYHFNTLTQKGTITKRNKDRIRIPANQIIHHFRREYVGQVRGIPDFATIMHKQKMLNGVHEAIVVGWRVAASKMGFFKTTSVDAEFDTGEYDEFGDMLLDATPGTFENLPPGVGVETFDPEYPTSTYESGHKVFMQQMANGLNVSSPTLSNNYEGVNYSSLRQALLEDREGWRCMQAEMVDGFYQPLFDEWYDWSANATRTISLPEKKRQLDPEIEWQPRGWPWVDPLKEVNAHEKAVNNTFRTHQSVLAETSGADFADTVATRSEENKMLQEHGLVTGINIDTSKLNDKQTDESKDEE